MVRVRMGWIEFEVFMEIYGPVALRLSDERPYTFAGEAPYVPSLSFRCRGSIRRCLFWYIKERTNGQRAAD